MQNGYTPTRLFRQPVGYLPDNENPTEAHTDQALLEAFRFPAPQYVHNRVWLPHREPNGKEILSKIWDFYGNHTSAALAMEPSSGALSNCGHIAIWMLVPEDEKTLEEAKEMRYDTYDREHFTDGLFRGHSSLTQHDEIGRYARFIATWYYPATTMYTLHLHNLGYDVGGFNCSITSPNTFNSLLGEYLPDICHPVMAVFAGTKASAFRHTGMRDTYTTEMCSGKSFMNSPWDTSADKTNYLGEYDGATGEKSKIAHGLVRWNGGKTGVQALTPEEFKALNYIKYSNKYRSLPKVGQHTP